MAKNSLGELESAPGANRRERAHYRRVQVRSKRDFIQSANDWIDDLSRNAHAYAHNGRVYDHWADEAHRLRGQMKKKPHEYRRDSEASFKNATELFNKVSELQGKIKDAERTIRKETWLARVDSTVAFVQTWGAKVSSL